MMNPPTDNLYKFIAISGVVIALFSASWLFWFENKLGEQILELLKTNRASQLELSRMQANMESQATILESLATANSHLLEATKKVEDLKKSNSSLDELKKAEAEFNKAKEEWDRIKPTFQRVMDLDEEQKKMAEQLAKITADRDNKVDAGDFIVAQMSRYGYWCRAGIGLGLALAIYGFLQWYKKEQKWQDILLELKAKEALKNNEQSIPKKTSVISNEENKESKELQGTLKEDEVTQKEKTPKQAIEPVVETH